MMLTLKGLAWYNGEIYEGTGQYGESILAKVDHKTGTYKKKIELGMDLFGEGVTILKDKIYQLTYISQSVWCTMLIRLRR